MLNVKGVPSIYRSIERVRSIWVNSDPTVGDAYLVSKLMVDALKEISHKSNHEFLKYPRQLVRESAFYRTMLIERQEMAIERHVD